MTSSGSVQAEIQTPLGWRSGGRAVLSSGSSWSLPLTENTYRFIAGGQVGGARFSIRTYPAGVVPGDTIDFQPDLRPFRLHVRNPDGTPADGAVEFRCARAGGLDPMVERQTVETPYTFVNGSIRLVGLDGADEFGRPSCLLQHYPRGEGLPTSHRFDVPADLTELVMVLGSPTLVDNAGPAADDDSVPDVIEAQGPNGGDGNGDGVPDHEQSNVTSVPGNGGNSFQPYVTIASPPGSTLAAVSTLRVTDPSVVTPPPAGTALPAGLVQFRIEGLAPGATRTVSIYSSDTAGVTSYAKYHDGEWTTLPASRVAVSASRVDVTLTDGGVGDDDGVANGVIVDPGGPAVVVSTKPQDLALGRPADVVVDATTPSGAVASYVPPVVTGSLAGNPAPVCSKRTGTVFSIGVTTVTCSVTDDRYGNSPVATSFTVTVRGAPQLLADLRGAVIGVGSGKALQSAVEKTMAALSRGDRRATCRGLVEFGVTVAAQLAVKRITLSKSVALAAAAVRIGRVVGC